MFLRVLLLVSLFGSAMLAGAANLRLHGSVTDLDTRTPLAHVLVRVYKDGVKQEAFNTAVLGRYSVVLDNNADYTLRFSLPGRVGKCYSVSTHGPEWAGDNKQVDLLVEITLFEEVAGLDLSYFDLPMGIARFSPINGQLSWNAEYADRVRTEVDRLMAEVTLKRATTSALATRNEEQDRHHQ